MLNFDSTTPQDDNSRNSGMYEKFEPKTNGKSEIWANLYILLSSIQGLQAELNKLNPALQKCTKSCIQLNEQSIKLSGEVNEGKWST